MKKLFYLIFAVLLYACETPIDEANNPDPTLSQEAQINPIAGLNFSGENMRIGSSQTCGGFFYPSNPHTTIASNHTYPAQNLNIDCLNIGDQFTVTFFVYDIPNKFVVKSGNNVVYNSGWKGVAMYPGQWGTSINNGNSITVTLTKNYTTTYEVFVETQTPPNSRFNPSTDNWAVQVNCQCPEPEPPCQNPPCPVVCACCNGWVDGEHEEYAEYKTYTVLIDVSCIANGGNFNFTVQAADIPNRFQILQNGSSVSDSGWIGQASFAGPWGQNLNASSSAVLPNVTKVANATYELFVETTTATSNYYPAFDYWSAQMSCGGGGGIQ